MTSQTMAKFQSYASNKCDSANGKFDFIIECLAAGYDIHVEKMNNALSKMEKDPKFKDATVEFKKLMQSAYW